ncbi:spore coat associated protein CotJA [Clostridium sp. AM46-21]|uniref:spore coat associated protein CotJA n=1 Tax=Clostridium sp. AM46-21 TaxID=2293033 RepID=UPI001FAABEEE|nr:spore coat associated protein CotJA [Clostridium sp. AM46-21]
MRNNKKGCRDLCRFSPHPIGMAYVPSQEFGELYDAKKGLCEGTMFPDLNLIFCGVRGK